jgi:DedD protein
MAKAASDEQIQMRRRARRRLVGAIALVTVIAVVLPWVLEHEPRPSEEPISVQIPSRDTPFEPRLVPGKEASPEPSVAEQTAPSGSGSDTLRAEQDKVLSAPEKAGARDRPAAAAEPKKAVGKAEGSEKQQQFVVQVAALADADKAAGIQQQLTAKGLKAYTEKVKTANGEVTRVRIGPFPSREAAEKERTRLKTLGFEGNVSPR